MSILETGALFPERPAKSAGNSDGEFGCRAGSESALVRLLLAYCFCSGKIGHASGLSPTNCWSTRRIPGSLASDDLSGAGSSHQGQFSSPNRGLGLKCAVSIWNLAGKMDSKFAGWNLKFVWWHSEFAHKFRFDICWMKFGINLLEFRWRHSEFSRRHSKFSWLLGFGTRIVAWIWNLPVVFVIFQVLFGIRPDLDLKFAWLDFKLSE